MEEIRWWLMLLQPRLTLMAVWWAKHGLCALHLPLSTPVHLPITASTPLPLMHIHTHTWAPTIYKNKTPWNAKNKVLVKISSIPKTTYITWWLFTGWKYAEKIYWWTKNMNTSCLSPQKKLKKHTHKSHYYHVPSHPKICTSEVEDS